MGRGKGIIYIATAAFLALAVFCGMLTAEETEPYLLAEVTSGSKTEQIRLWQDGEGDFFVFLPGYARLEETRLRTNAPGKFLLDGQMPADGVSCGAYQLDTAYALTQPDGTALGTLTFVQSRGVGTMYIDVRSGSMDYIHENRGNEEPGSYSLYTPGGALEHSGSVESLKGRGNATWWSSEKKPYSLKLAAEADLLQMGAAKNWVLLANSADAAHIKNKAVMDFAGEAGLAYTPQCEWVDLYLNGEYAGLYLLSERNEIHAQRVDIPAEGSFLVSLELESRLVEREYPHIVTEAEQALRIHESSLDTQTLTDIWQSAENAILAEDGVDPVTGKSWQELIDLDSWAEKYLLEEVFGNADACSISQFFYYDGGKIFAGPAWDYDATMMKFVPQTLYGNRFQACEGKPTPWFHGLYQKDAFLDRVKELYETKFRPLLAELLGTGMDAYGRQIAGAAAVNRRRWQTADPDVSREKAKAYMLERMEFLDSLWLREEEYCLVFVELGEGISGAYYAVRPGECLRDLPSLGEDTLGWYSLESGEAFDVTKPVWEDTAIYLKKAETQQEETAVYAQEETGALRVSRLAPAILFALALAALVCADAVRNGPRSRKNG